MRVTILGSGTAVPVPDRFPAGALVDDGRTRVLVDLGPGTLRRFAQTGMPVSAIDAVLLTHYHTDHCGDLPALLFALRNPKLQDRKPLRILGAPGLHQLHQHLLAAWPWLAPRGYRLEIEEIEPGEHSIGSLSMAAFPIQHTEASLGYRLHSNGRCVAFSGDADLGAGIVDLAKDVDLFVCDAAFPDALRVAGHLTPRLAGQVAATAGARCLCLTHFYPECAGHDLLHEARASYDGRIELAADLRCLAV